MGVRQKILEILQPRSEGLRIRDVRVGLGYTAVQLEDGRTGVAYTLGKETMRGCSALGALRPMVGKSAGDFLRLLESRDPLESVLGLATANALANVAPSRGFRGDVLDALNPLPLDKVGMIGYFGPLVPTLEFKVAELEIFDEHSESEGPIRPAAEAHEYLSTCDIALITSTTIINNTIDQLLESASRCRETVLLGSSTPLLAEAFVDTPVTILSGITVDDSAGILRVISEACGTRFFKPYVTKWNILLRDN